MVRYFHNKIPYTSIFINILFSSSVYEDMKLTNVTDSNRDSIADIIGNLKMHGGTCLGNGLMQGMDVRLQQGQYGNLYMAKLQ